MSRRFQPPWSVEQMPGGFKVVDATANRSPMSIHARTRVTPHIAQVLSEDEARRIASKIAKLPELLGKQ